MSIFGRKDQFDFTGFRWSKCVMCPTDNEVIAIYKRHKELLRETELSWQQQTWNGQVMARDYKDFESVRLRLTDVGGKLTPVINIRPVIDHDVLVELTNNVSFFRTYMRFRKELTIPLVVYKNKSIEAPTERRVKIRSLINAIKLMIKLKNTGYFAPQYFGLEVLRNIETHVFHPTIRVDMIGSVVGDHYKATGEVNTDVDDRTYDGFVRWIRNVHGV